MSELSTSWKSWPDSAKRKFLRRLESEVAKARADAGTSYRPESLVEYSEATLGFTLHNWQRDHLCPILERLRHERGLRILLHAPPQFGKSVLVSQRLPSYLLGHDPLRRIGLACYNETHAIGFGAVVRDLMASEEYAAMFPRSVISGSASAKDFSTRPRAALLDAQPSFRAMGLLSGFVGRGVDDLLIDDPYASAADAQSLAVNGAVWRWWSQTASPRVFPDTNVVVMFHRYHDEDLAAKLLAQGGWEYYRFPSIADENEDGSDPTGRAFGQPLSPMRSLDDLDRIKALDPYTFAGQFQGTPRPDQGLFFQTDQIRIVPARPAKIVSACRAWDIAATAGGGDYTAGVLIGKLDDGRFCILDVVLLQGGPDEVDRVMDQTAALDGRSVHIHLAQDPGSAGKRDAQAIARRLAGHHVTVEAVSGSKEVRARGFSSQVNVGNVEIVSQPAIKVRTGPHAGRSVTDALLTMLQGFPLGNVKKDGVDAAADAFNALGAKRVGRAY